MAGWIQQGGLKVMVPKPTWDVGSKPPQKNSNRKEGREGRRKEGEKEKEREEKKGGPKKEIKKDRALPWSRQSGKRGPSWLLQQIGMNFLAINSAGSWPHCLSLYKIQYFPFCYSWHNDKKGRNKSSPFLMKLLGILFFIGIDMTITILIPGLTQESHSNMNLSMATSPTLHTKTILTV